MQSYAQGSFKPTEFHLNGQIVFFKCPLMLLCFAFQHYASIMKYISQPPLLLDVHIHKPLLPARTWMDSLLAFFPGLQVSNTFRGAVEKATGLNRFRTSVVLQVNFNITPPHPIMIHFSGIEGRHPACHRDTWDALPSYKETQFSARGKFSLVPPM